MPIADTIKRIIDMIIRENSATGGHSPTSQEVQRRAIVAITAGQGIPPNAITQEWRAYMSYLLSVGETAAIDPAQLSRLLPDDGSTDADRQKERAYIVGNGMCGSTTTDTLLNGDMGQTTVNLDRL